MENIHEQKYSIDRSDRNKLNGHRSFVVWFTGLSGAGKSTLANGVQQALFQEGCQVYTLDGDNIRLGLNAGLTFSEEDRTENLRRIAEVAKLLVDAGTIALCAFVSPLEADRKLVRSIIGDADFIEIFVNASIEECEKRDPKGLYAKARTGEIKNFTGVSAPYESPTNPAIEIQTEMQSIEEAVAEIVHRLTEKLPL